MHISNQVDRIEEYGYVGVNIFSQTSGAVAIGTTAQFEGVILAKKLIAMKTGTSADCWHRLRSLSTRMRLCGPPRKNPRTL
jgi:hypothetical protein